MTLSRTKDFIRIPGNLYLLLAVTGFFSLFSLDSFSIYLFDSWVQYLECHQSLFTAGLLCYASMVLVWLLLAWSFYNRFRRVDRATAGLLLLFVIIGSGMEIAILMLKSVPLVMISLKGVIPIALFTSWMKSAHFLFMMAGKVHKTVNLFYALWLFFIIDGQRKKVSLLFSQPLL